MTARSRAQMIDETRAKLLRAARAAFAASGYAETSMDELTASVGLTRGALYHHFGGKSGLLAAVADAIDADIDAELDRVASAADGPAEALAARAEAFVLLTLEPEAQRILFRDAPAVLGPRVSARDSACVQALAELIGAGQAAGSLRPEGSPGALAVLVDGALNAASAWVAAAEPEQQDERCAEARAASRALIAALRTREPDAAGPGAA
ncbi:TetR/AcrR family transcriptional regulator [Leucobacter sp. M11]|uniref:TetR/AcrR family transcriptional regulator n=1 Tax=Leucobacter sp. M11 TaxID=2993565 RepID=UPI002D7F8AFE|nr:helix-turn-helix domain-containing protein [Leucobacter sp. M11]MEB4613527.1 helix-turn-helix domain containing protein [Leucobacter sp. M11]